MADRWTRIALVVAIAPASAVMLAACGASSATAGPTRALHSTASIDTSLERAFVGYKVAHSEMRASDQITPAPVSDGATTQPLVAWDEPAGRYYAVANYALTGSPSYAAQVSFQDGGSYGVFSRTPRGAWEMQGSPGLPLCPGIVPSVVWRAWRLASPPACSH